MTNIVLTGCNYPDRVAFFNGALKIAHLFMFKGLRYQIGQEWHDNHLGLHDQFPRGMGLDDKGNIFALVIHLKAFLDKRKIYDLHTLSREDQQVVNFLYMHEGQDPKVRREPRPGQAYLEPSLRLTFAPNWRQDQERLNASLRQKAAAPHLLTLFDCVLSQCCSGFVFQARSSS